jgi:galactitol-specific phosphotransferase system IIC component
MNTIGHKMNNKLTNVIGYKFANKMHTMGHKMTPLTNSSPQQISNVIMPNTSTFDKKIIENIPSMDYRMGDKMRKKMKSRLTK